MQCAMASGVLAVRQSLGVEEVIQLLTSAPDTQVVVTDPPTRPKAGEVYLYKAEVASKKGVIDIHTFE